MGNRVLVNNLGRMSLAERSEVLQVRGGARGMRVRRWAKAASSRGRRVGWGGQCRERPLAIGRLHAYAGAP